MKESETIKEYSDRLFGIVNKVRLLGISFTDFRIVEKILVTVPKKYEASITTLENTKDLSKITLAELLNALQAQEQRRLMRQARVTEGALQVQYLDSNKKKLKKKTRLQAVIRLLPVNFRAKENLLREIFHHVNTTTRYVIHHLSAGRDLMQGVANVTNLDMKQLSARQNLRNKKKMLKLLVKMMKIRCL
jgi:hypothetical protein